MKIIPPPSGGHPREIPTLNPNSTHGALSRVFFPKKTAHTFSWEKNGDKIQRRLKKTVTSTLYGERWKQIKQTLTKEINKSILNHVFV